MAAYKIKNSLLPLVSICVILLVITDQAVAGRNVPENANKDEMKQPQFWFGNDGSYLIPGIGRVLKPHKFFPYTSPFTTPSIGGSSGSSGSSGTGTSGSGHKYIPGADDTFVPNPGFEVPNPGQP